MDNEAPLRVLLGVPAERRLLELLDRFAAQGWISLYVRRPELLRELLVHGKVDAALLHPTQVQSLPTSCPVPVVLLGNEPASVIEQKLLALTQRAPAQPDQGPLGRSGPSSARTEPPPRPEPSTNEPVRTGLRAPTALRAQAGGPGGPRKDQLAQPGQEAEVRGDLQRTPLVVLLLDIAFERCTGTLALELGDVQRVFSFRDGIVVASSSSIPAERLGAMLARAGVISQAQRQTLQQALELQPGLLTGQHLVRVGLLSPATLEAALVQQLERRLGQALLTEQGSFTWTALQHLPPERVVRGGPELADFVARQVLQELGEGQVTSMMAAEATRVVQRTDRFFDRLAVLRQHPELVRYTDRIDNHTRLDALISPLEIAQQLRVFLLLHLARAIGFGAREEGAEMKAEELAWGRALPSLPEVERTPTQREQPAPPPEGRPAEQRSTTPFSGTGAWVEARTATPYRLAAAGQRTTTPPEILQGTPRSSDPPAAAWRHGLRRPGEPHEPPPSGEPEAPEAAPSPGAAEDSGRREPRTSSGLLGVLRRSLPHGLLERMPAARREVAESEASDEEGASKEAVPRPRSGPAAHPPDYRYRPPFPMARPPASNKTAGLMVEGKHAMVQGRFQEAAGLFEAAWKADTAYAEALSLCGWCLLRHDPRDEKRVREGLDSMQMAVSLAGQEPLPFLRYGLALAELGRTEQAQVQLKAALRLNPHLQEAREALGRL